MKVLMFGWEFPPHISGGLGTACYGITSSLSKENIDILFVVPKLHGEEAAARTNFINASNVHISPSGNLEKYISSASVNTDIKEPLFRVIKKGSTTSYITVPSTLSAYRSPGFEEHASSIEHWNYSLPEKEILLSTGKIAKPSDDQSAIAIQAHETKASYNFSGSYGPNLLEEVRRYGQVGAEIAKNFDFDVIHAHDWMTYLAGIAAKKVSGKPLIVHVHATEYDRSGENVDSHVHALEYQGMAEADCVVTVSHWTKKIVMARYNLPDEKVKVIHNGIIPRPEEITRQFTAPPVGAQIVTFLGRITHQKGPLFFVEAARKVLHKIPNTHFVVAGAGDLMPVMIERIAQLRMSSNFHFTGFLKNKDIEKVWSMSNVYVMPSVSEPFGIAPLEAIQAGVPVIISKQSGVAEVMPHAMKVDFWNSEELAAAICSVLKYKSLSNTLAKNSAEEIRHITWANAAKKLNQLYYGLTAIQQPD